MMAVNNAPARRRFCTPLALDRLIAQNRGMSSPAGAAATAIVEVKPLAGRNGRGPQPVRWLAALRQLDPGR